MQLTNILRDVGEDAERGRCYLPDDDLAAFGLTRSDVLARDPSLARDERWRPMMAYLIGRARSLYEAAAPGIALLSADSRRCATACSIGYAAILGAIEAQGYDTLSRRARVSKTTRMGILWHAWRDGARVPATIGSGHGPFVRWGSVGSAESARWA
jgi:phytoene synthase